MHHRWVVLALLFAATTINYLDRIVFSFLVPVIRKEMVISDRDFGFINAAFQIAYTLAFLGMGNFIDRKGTKFGYAVSIVWWSLAAAGHVVAGSAWGLGFWRAVLGLGEAGNFPAAIKATTEWFPKRDRALATGIFNAGTTVASIVGPPLFAWMVIAVGWRWCFLITAGSGFLWLAWWMASYRNPTPGEGGETEAKAPAMSWGETLRYRQTWGFALAKFFSDPVWWFYLSWLPLYFIDVRHFDLKQTGWALPVIYSTAGVGSIVGGWLSGVFIRRGWHQGRARKAGMAIFAACMPIAATAALVESPVLAIGLIALAGAAHQGWSANLYTTTSDVFPQSAIASVTGIGGCAGGVGGVIFSYVVPAFVIPEFGYTPVFLVLGAFHLTGLLCAHVFMGRMEPIERSR